MIDPRRAALVAALGTAAALSLGGTASAAESAPADTGGHAATGHEQGTDGTTLSPSGPLDQIFGAPGDLYGTLSSVLPD